MPCNSLVLAEESHFFTAKFSNPDFGGSSGVVEFPDLDGDTLETVVTALLTATIKLDGRNIERILHCADMLQVCTLSQRTSSYESCSAAGEVLCHGMEHSAHGTACAVDSSQPQVQHPCFSALP